MHSLVYFAIKTNFKRGYMLTTLRFKIAFASSSAFLRDQIQTLTFQKNIILFLSMKVR